MFWHLFKYRIKVMLKKKSLLFWTCAFPIILGLFFNAAFSGLDNTDVLETADVAIVNEAQNRGEIFTETLGEIKSEETVLFKTKEVTSAKASELLKDGKVSGIYTVREDAIDLKIATEGIAQTILHSYLNQYLQNEQMIKNIFSTGRAVTEEDLADLSVQTNYIQENKNSRRGSEKSFFFFTLVGMSCMYGFFWGLRNATDEQANQSANGIRLSLVPQNKLIVILSNMAASFVLFYIELMIILLFFRFVYGVDFGERWPYILLTCAVGSLNALAFGSFISNRLKIGQSQKESIGVSISMIMSVLAGMMGTTGLKYYISVHLPLLGIINPVNLISESLYQLYYYRSLDAYFMNLFYLALMAIFFTLLCFLSERRAQYDSI